MTDHAAVIRDFIESGHEHPDHGRDALAALAAMEQELDALADVAAAGNEREKRLEAELAEAHLSLETYQAAITRLGRWLRRLA